MKSILLKLDDKLFEATEEHVKAGNTTRSNYIKTAIDLHNKQQEIKEIENQIRKEVRALNQHDPDKEINRGLEISAAIDLQKHLDE